MICERCNTKDAVIYLTRLTNGVTIVRHFCVSCATAIGASTVIITVEHPSQPKARDRWDGDEE